MARIEFAPLDLVVAVCQGIDVCFAGLKLSTVPPPWQEYSEDYDAVDSSGFEFKLRSLANDVTRELDAGFNKNLEIWNAQVKEFGASVAGRAPSLPSDIFFEHICAQVEDDLGTEYVWIGGEMASFDAPWEATWIYSPAPPEDAEHLVLKFVVDGLETGHICTIDLRS